MSEGAALPDDCGTDDFAVTRTLTTRWSDEDVYGHVNNVVYYSYFDTAVNAHLIEAGGVDTRTLPAIGVVVESSCRFLRSLSFPAPVVAGLRVERLGRSSVTYAIGLFQGPDPTPAGLGRFVHVYVDRDTRRPVAVPAEVRAVVEPMVVRAGP